VYTLRCSRHPILFLLRASTQKNTHFYPTCSRGNAIVYCFRLNARWLNSSNGRTKKALISAFGNGCLCNSVRAAASDPPPKHRSLRGCSAKQLIYASQPRSQIIKFKTPMCGFRCVNVFWIYTHAAHTCFLYARRRPCWGRVRTMVERKKTLCNKAFDKRQMRA
jgi:hypothetical protein